MNDITHPPVQRKRKAQPPAPYHPPQSSERGSELVQIIQRALADPGFDVSKLKELLEMKERWEANEARKAFAAAMAAFKANPPVLTKNKRVNFTTQKGTTDYRHATLDQVSEVIGKELTKHGLSHHWDVQQTGGRIIVSCVLQHVLGHSEKTTIEAGADESGSKNSIQAVGSTITYLQRYSLLAATGMAVKGQDDDGAGGPKMDEGKLADHLAAIDEAADDDSLRKAFGKAMHDAQKAGDIGAQRKITDAKDNRKNELGIK